MVVEVGSQATCYHDPPEKINEERLTLLCRWRGQTYDIPLTSSEARNAVWSDLKQVLYEQLSVPINRQKYLGVSVDGTRGVLQDSVQLSSVKFGGPDGRSFTLVGTPEEEQLPDEVAEAALTFRSDYNSIEAQKVAARANAHKNMREQLNQAVSKVQILWIREARSGKKLLVLDIDYTIYDCKGASHGFAIEDLKRPYLELFLGSIWPHYDYVIWSQTRWQWIEMKCTELGLLTDPDMGPCFTLDKYAMLSWNLSDKAHHTHDSKKPKCNVKSLELIWRKFPKLYGPHNTLHVDDLARNFRMNPCNGVLVKPYLRENRKSDQELLKLGRYLVACAALPDVRDRDHSQWTDSDLAKIQ